MSGMRESIEEARRGATRTSELASAAQGARDRVESYRVKGDSAAVTSFGRMRELEQERELAEDRLRRAQSHEGQPAAGEQKATAQDPLALELSELADPPDPFGPQGEDKA